MKIKTFAVLSKKAKVKSADDKLVTVSADRNLFDRLLIVSRSRDINLREVLRYELSSVPCALAHTDGSLRKTTKSVLLSSLEVVPGGLILKITWVMMMIIVSRGGNLYVLDIELSLTSVPTINAMINFHYLL